MPDNKDIYGNVDRYSLFFDSRSGTYQWYPTQYKKHPLWSQYLTIQGGQDAPVIYPGNIYPGDVYTGLDSKVAVADVVRPMGLHGIGTQRFDPVKTIYPVPTKNIYPDALLYPSSTTYTGND
jgi:hypothetical protein